MAQEYTDPGYAVASTLDDILTKRKAEARQALLDKLHEDQIRSQMEIARENADSNKMYREAWAKQRDEEAAAKFKGGLVMGQPLDATDPTYGGKLTSADVVPGVTPESGAVVGPQGLQGGPKIFGMTPDVTGKDAADFIEGSATTGITSKAPAVKPPTFYGSPKEHETLRKNESMRAYANTLPADSPLRMAIEYNLASGGDNPPAAAITPPKPTTLTVAQMGRDGKVRIDGKVVDPTKLPAGTRVMQEPAPPGSGGGMPFGLYPSIAPDGTLTWSIFNKREGTITPPNQKVDATGKVIPTPTPVPKPEAAPKPVVPPNLQTALTKADAEIDKHSGWGGTTARAAAVAQRNGIVDQIFALHPQLAATVKNMVTAAKSNPALANASFDDLAKGFKPQPNPQDLEIMRVLYNIAMGKK